MLTAKPYSAQLQRVRSLDPATGEPMGGAEDDALLAELLKGATDLGKGAISELQRREGEAKAKAEADAAARAAAAAGFFGFSAQELLIGGLVILGGLVVLGVVVKLATK